MALPTLATPHLVLAPESATDLDRLWRLLTNPEVRRHLCDDVEFSRAEVERLLEASLALAADGFGCWMISTKAGDFVGFVELRPAEAAAVFDKRLAGETEPVIAIAPEFWGRGYAHEATSAAIAYGFAQRELARLVAIVDEPNHRSHALMRRLGFRRYGASDGKKYRFVSYRLSPADFAAAGEALNR